MLETILSLFDGTFVNNKLVASLALILMGLVVRWLVTAHFKRLPNDEEGLAKRWINTARNAINLLIVLGLIVVWLSELRLVALSIATFIVALVVATREFIQCFVGSLYHASTKTFTIGDWIKINNHYGEVVSSNWLSTTLLEIDFEAKSYGYTGKTLIIPNNQLVANVVHNLNYMRRYIAHSFTIVREPDPINLFKLKQPMLERATIYCEPFEDVAKRYSQLIENRLGANIQGPEPSVTITTSNIGKSQFTLTVFCPTDQCAEIEQKLTEDFFALWHEKLEEYNLKKEQAKAEKSAK